MVSFVDDALNSLCARPAHAKMMGAHSVASRNSNSNRSIGAGQPKPTPTVAKDQFDVTDTKGTLIWEHPKGECPFDFYEKVRSLYLNGSTVVDLVRKDGTLYAMKYVKRAALSDAKSSQTVKEIRNERAKLRLLDHPNIITVRPLF
jgi:hypothetical protein